MRQGSIHRFVPFNLQLGTSELCHDRIQRIIYYGESRLRKAITAMSTGEEKNQGYFHLYLWKELVRFYIVFLKVSEPTLSAQKHFFMTYIGLGTSVCICLDIPIVLRSLAYSFAGMSKADLPTKFDLDLLALLEGGTKPTDPFFLVDVYDHAWWKGTGIEKRLGPISEETILDALFHYEEEMLKVSVENKHTSDMGATTYPLPSQHVNYNTALLDAVHHAHFLSSGLHTSAQAE